MLRMNLRIASIFFLISATVSLHAQDTLSLDQSFQEMMSQSRTWEVYEMIPTERLNSFWASVTDSIAVKQDTIVALRGKIDAQQAAVSEARQEAATARAEMGALGDQISTISFLGMQMGKGSYHALVWVIIGILTVVIFVILGRFRETHKVTAKAQKELQAVSSEYEDFKDRARKQQAKTKRERQTAINELEARKRGEL